MLCCHHLTFRRSSSPQGRRTKPSHPGILHHPMSLSLAPAWPGDSAETDLQIQALSLLTSGNTHEF